MHWRACVLLWAKFNASLIPVRESAERGNTTKGTDNSMITSEMTVSFAPVFQYSALHLDVWALLFRVRESAWFCTSSESECSSPAVCDQVNHEMHQEVFCVLTAFETPKICFLCVGLMTWLINNFELISLLFSFSVNKQIITVFVLMTSS